MYFKELLRVSRGLYILTIILVLIVVANLVLHQGDTSGADRVPLSLLFAIAGVITTIFAGAFGSSLAAENNGHLDVAWTKPASRNRYALITMTVDLSATMVAFALCLVAALAVFAVSGLTQLLYVDADAGQNLSRFLLLPVAFYGLWQALTASLRAQAGMVVGCSVIAASILLALDASVHGGAWRVIIQFVNYFNPLVYGTYQTGTQAITYPFGPWQLNVTCLAAIAIVGIFAALAQWRKVEA